MGKNVKPMGNENKGSSELFKNPNSFGFKQEKKAFPPRVSGSRDFGQCKKFNIVKIIFPSYTSLFHLLSPCEKILEDLS